MAFSNDDPKACLTEISHMLEHHQLTCSESNTRKREEIHTLKSLLKAAKNEIKSLKERLANQEEERVFAMGEREQALEIREAALLDRLKRGDKELHQKWDMLFAAQQRLGEQRSEFISEKEAFEKRVTQSRSAPVGLDRTPTSTPRRKISSPISAARADTTNNSYLNALSPLSQ